MVTKGRHANKQSVIQITPVQWDGGISLQIQIHGTQKREK